MDEIQWAYKERLYTAEKLVRRHCFYSAGLGFIPIPFADMAGVSANQILMLKRMADLYDVSFKKNIVHSLVSTLLADMVTGAGLRLASSYLKALPIVGGVIGGIPASAYSYVATFAIGKVFIMHFESGGSFLNFDPAEVRTHFEEELKNGERHFRRNKRKKPK